MPIGFVVNKRYAVDTRYDRYAELDVFKRILREVGKRGYGCSVTYSAMTRGYCCEVRKYETKFKNSANIYYVTEGHKYGPNPLEVLARAVRQSIPLDALLLVLLLEAEVVQLGIEIKDRRALEDELEKALDNLADIVRAFEWVEPLSADPSDVAAAHYENMQRTIKLDNVRVSFLSAAFTGKPAPDLDDDL